MVSEGRRPALETRRAAFGEIPRKLRYLLSWRTVLCAGARGLILLGTSFPETSFLARTVGKVQGFGTVRTLPPTGEPVRLTFSDVTDRAGIDFIHVLGASGRKYMVESLGSGAAFFDWRFPIRGGALPGQGKYPGPRRCHSPERRLPNP